MNTRLSAVVVILGLIASVAARAADLPAPAVAPIPPVYNWTGFYIGANAGYGWNTGDGPLQCTNSAGVSFGSGCGLIPFAGLKPAGVIGGGQVGFNWSLCRRVGGRLPDHRYHGLHADQRTVGIRQPDNSNACQQLFYRIPPNRLVRHHPAAARLCGLRSHAALRHGRCRLREQTAVVHRHRASVIRRPKVLPGWAGRPAAASNTRSPATSPQRSRGFITISERTRSRHIRCRSPTLLPAA